MTRESKRHTAQAQEYLNREFHPLHMWIGNVQRICRNAEQTKQTYVLFDLKCLNSHQFVHCIGKVCCMQNGADGVSNS